MSLLANKRVCFLLLILTCLLVFYPSLANQFTNWDDNEFILENPVVQQMSWQNVGTIFTTRFEGAYLPLTNLSFALEHHFVGFKPFTYHLDNLILHILNVCLVMLIMLALTKNTPVAFLTALLFAISPLRVESVAWITERKDVLFSFFFLLSIYAYIRRYLLVSVFFFALACIAKFQAISLPFVLILIDYWFKRKDHLKCWVEKWPFFLVAATMLWITSAGVMTIFTNVATYSVIDKFFLTCFALNTYAIKIFFPYSLALLYPYPSYTNGYFPWFVYGAPLTIAAWFIIACKTYRHHPVVMIGGLWFLATILLALTNVSSGGSILNDRYTYLPSIGLYWMLSVGIYRISQRQLKIALMTVLACYVLISGFISYERCKVWFDGVSLWSDTIRQYPHLAFIYENRGSAYSKKGQIDLALKDFDQAIFLNPQFVSAYNNRAIIHDQLGHSDIALNDFNQAILKDPSYGQSYFNRSVFYARQGKFKEAYEDAKKAQGLGIAISSDFMHQLEGK